MFLNTCLPIISIACLADEELQAEEESIEELRRKAEEERFRAQLEAQQREEERRKEEERRFVWHNLDFF